MTLLRSAFALSLLAAACLTPSAASQAGDLKVVVTIKPIHSLVTAIMEGVGAPALLVEGTASPHTFALKPSGARAIQAADVFIRVGPAVEPFTERIVATLPPTVTLVTLADTTGLTLLDRRTGATFEAHSHGDDHHGGHHHDHDDHDDEAAEGAKDGHIWLDPGNAARMAGKIAAVLSARDPAHVDAYAANAARLETRLKSLDAEIAAQMAPLKGRPFIVFHDATQYFEARFGLEAIGSVTVSPDVQPSAKRLSALRAKIAGLAAACVFAEPLFNENLLHAVTEGLPAKSGTLDAEGLLLDPGGDLYFTLMRSMAASLSGCLSP